MGKERVCLVHALQGMLRMKLVWLWVELAYRLPFMDLMMRLRAESSPLKIFFI